MHHNYIEYLTNSCKEQVIESNFVYEFRGERGWAIVQRLLFWCLRKIGAFSCFYEKTYTHHTIDAGSFVERLYKMDYDLLRTYDQQGAHLLIGSADYAALMQCEETKEWIRFKAPYSKSGLQKMMGMSVVIVPWMKGVVVIPQLPPLLQEICYDHKY